MILFKASLSYPLLFINGGDRMNIEDKLTWTVKETSQLIGLSRNSTYRGILTGEIPHVKVGKRILIPRVALERMLSEVGRSKAD